VNAFNKGLSTAASLILILSSLVAVGTTEVEAGTVEGARSKGSEIQHSVAYLSRNKIEILELRPQTTNLPQNTAHNSFSIGDWPMITNHSFMPTPPSQARTASGIGLILL
jgi:hypothetical protein